MKSITVTLKDIKEIKKLIDEVDALKEKSLNVDGYNARNYGNKELIIESKEKSITNNVQITANLLKVDYDTVIDMAYDFEFAKTVLKGQSEKQEKQVAEKASNKNKVIKSQSKQTPIMAASKPKGKAIPKKKGMTTPKVKKGVSVAQQKNQARIKRISSEATKIQREGGKKQIPAKAVYRINRADAVKKAAKTVK